MHHNKSINYSNVNFNYPVTFQFLRSRVGGSRNGVSQATVSLAEENDKTLLFESRFESGNLAKAVQV